MFSRAPQARSGSPGAPPPKTRILVAGNKWVGKSTLINQTFGLSFASNSNLKMGEEDINAEIPSPNSRFILHDSQGFEVGNCKPFSRVKHFIEERQKMAHPADKLHAIWLCINTPIGGPLIIEPAYEGASGGMCAALERSRAPQSSRSTRSRSAALERSESKGFTLRAEGSL